MNKTDKTRMPGFCGEASLYQPSRPYHTAAALTVLAGNNAGQIRVEPMQIPSCDFLGFCCFFQGNFVCCELWYLRCL